MLTYILLFPQLTLFSVVVTVPCGWVVLISVWVFKIWHFGTLHRWKRKHIPLFSVKSLSIFLLQFRENWCTWTIGLTDVGKHCWHNDGRGCRQEKLEQLAARFDRKAGMRETWLSENQRLVSQDNFGYDLAAVEAATKKHEAIETDINAYSERVQAVVSVAQELQNENYHDIERINNRFFLVARLLLPAIYPVVG